MISSIANKVVKGYIKEACEILCFEESYVKVVYVSELPALLDIPQFSLITPDGCLVLNETWVNTQISNETPTPLRHVVYSNVRMLFQRSKNPDSFNQYSNETIIDALAFSSAVQILKGLTIPPLNEYLIKMVQRLLRDELNIDTVYAMVSRERGDTDNFWIFRLSDKEEMRYLFKYFKEPAKSYVRVIDVSEKGTESNPFDDINEAFEFIQKLEKEAFYKDNLLQEISTQKYFYDLNWRQFKVPWASPYVAFYEDSTIPANGFIVNQNQPHPDRSFYFTLKPNLYGKKFLYRGQNRDYPKPCTPNLFRDETKTYFLDDMIWSQEMELLLKTHPLVRLLQDGIEIMHDRFCILMNLAGLTQHYYHKTRFLDLTSDIDAAKFFATTSYNPLTDEYTPVHETDKLGLIYSYELQMPCAFTRNKGYELSVIGKQVFMRSGAQHGFLLGMDRGVDFKKIPQVRKFYFRHNPTISDEIFKRSDKGKRYFPTDILEEVWKTEYKKRLEEGIVSSDTVRLNVSRNPGETYESICQKLNDRNIIVDSTYSPSFPPELIDIYYESIKDGWWEVFCSDIYFHGGDAALYKDCLMKIPERNEYKWAFKRQ